MRDDSNPLSVVIIRDNDDSDPAHLMATENSHTCSFLLSLQLLCTAEKTRCTIRSVQPQWLNLYTNVAFEFSSPKVIIYIWRPRLSGADENGKCDVDNFSNIHCTCHKWRTKAKGDGWGGARYPSVKGEKCFVCNNHVNDFQPLIDVEFIMFSTSINN